MTQSSQLWVSLSLILVVHFLGLTIWSSLELCNLYKSVPGWMLTDSYPLAAGNGYLLICHQWDLSLSHFVSSWLLTLFSRPLSFCSALLYSTRYIRSHCLLISPEPLEGIRLRWPGRCVPFPFLTRRIRTMSHSQGIRKNTHVCSCPTMLILLCYDSLKGPEETDILKKKGIILLSWWHHANWTGWVCTQEGRR